MKKLLSLMVCIALLLCALPAFAEEISVTGKVTEVEKYGHALLDVTIEDFTKLGPTDIPKVTGLSFDQIVIGSHLDVNNKETAKYAMKLVDCIHKSSLEIAEVYVSADQTATMYVGDIKILMGVDESTEEKIHDLRDFFDDVKGLNGVLDMQELSKNNLGYSFKTN